MGRGGLNSRGDDIGGSKVAGGRGRNLSSTLLRMFVLVLLFPGGVNWWPCGAAFLAGPAPPPRPPPPPPAYIHRSYHPPLHAPHHPRRARPFRPRPPPPPPCARPPLSLAHLDRRRPSVGVARSDDPICVLLLKNTKFLDQKHMSNTQTPPLGPRSLRRRRARHSRPMPSANCCTEVPLSTAVSHYRTSGVALLWTRPTRDTPKWAIRPTAEQTPPATTRGGAGGRDEEVKGASKGGEKEEEGRTRSEVKRRGWRTEDRERSGGRWRGEIRGRGQGGPAGGGR